ncbi:MAG: hypothetical protein HUJ68_04540 [Clostridia bacterium]|nr:hypothetical protein [Clostridia bacterium]
MKECVRKLFEAIELTEASLSKDIFRYASKDIPSLKKDLFSAKYSLNNFFTKYENETKESLDFLKNEQFENDYQSCITYLTLFLAMCRDFNTRAINAIHAMLDSMNEVSNTLFPLNRKVHISYEELRQAANDFRMTNIDLRKAFENLKEHKLSQFDTSKITDKAISEYGLNEAQLINATFGNNNITLQFEVQSTGDNTHVDLTGKTQVFLKRGYSVTIQFINTQNYISPSNIDKNTIAQQFNNIVKNCDAKVYCDCPAFYWQGMAEKDAKQGDSYFGFKGQRGTGEWNQRHNVNGPQACKHIWSAIYFINTEQKQICNKLLSNIVDSASVFNDILN